MPRTTWATLAPLLLGITLPRLAGAQSPQSGEGGPALSAGSDAGFTEIDGTPVTALGVYIAAGHSFGRVALEARYDLLYLEEDANKVLYPRAGALGRLGVTARLTLGSLGTRWVGADSRLSWWIEGGVGRQWGRFADSGLFARNDVAIGGGWLLLHGTHRRVPAPTKVGWFFGWQLTAAPPPRSEIAVAGCRKGFTCPPPRATADHDTSLLVSCGLAVSF